MGKIKKHFTDLSLKTSFMLIMIAFILIAFVLVEVEKTLLENAQIDIAFRYSDIVTGYNSQKVWGGGNTFFLSPKDSNYMRIYEILLWLVSPVSYVICAYVAGLIFFKSKIKKPLNLLTSSTEKIGNDNLDFEVKYDKTDEMGKLCLAFEQMRFELLENHREMWRQMEERKRLNAAFSHDLRTPLTVLEGHLEMLHKFTPDNKLSLDETIETYSIMSGQVTRLKNYVSSMNTLQRLEDIPIQKQTIQSGEYYDTLNDTAAIVCGQKRLIFHKPSINDTLFIDPEIVLQVYENMLSNAIRYAKSMVSVSCKNSNNILTICVCDDGKGFNKKALSVATDPFYSTDRKNNNQQHFGLGLNICKILCQRHGGSIQIENLLNGGAKVTATFDMNK